MPGLTDYTAKSIASYLTGIITPPAIIALYAALFTAAPSDAGTGGTEVSGGGYARPQVAGVLQAGGAFTTSSPNITLGSSAPAWLTALGDTAPGKGVNVYDVANGQQIGTVASVSGTAVTLQANAAHASTGSTDFLYFSAFGLPSASSGAEPATTPVQVTNGAQINFAAATASQGTALAQGLSDSSSGGNLLAWDYLGNNAWQPATMSAASPGVITCPAHGFLAGGFLAVSAKQGGSIPSFSQSNLTGVLTAANVTTNTFTAQNGGTDVNTSTAGDFLVRGLTEQPIAINVALYIPSGQFKLSFA